MRLATPAPGVPTPPTPPTPQRTAATELRPADDAALAEPRGATRWASSPLLRATSPLTAGQRWSSPSSPRTGR